MDNQWSGGLAKYGSYIQVTCHGVTKKTKRTPLPGTMSDEVCLDESGFVPLDDRNVDVPVRRSFRDCIQLFGIQITVGGMFGMHTKPVVHEEG